MEHRRGRHEHSNEPGRRILCRGHQYFRLPYRKQRTGGSVGARHRRHSLRLPYALQSRYDLSAQPAECGQLSVVSGRTADIRPRRYDRRAGDHRQRRILRGIDQCPGLHLCIRSALSGALRCLRLDPRRGVHGRQRQQHHRWARYARQWSDRIARTVQYHHRRIDQQPLRQFRLPEHRGRQLHGIDRSHQPAARLGGGADRPGCLAARLRRHRAGSLAGRRRLPARAGHRKPVGLRRRDRVVRGTAIGGRQSADVHVSGL